MFALKTKGNAKEMEEKMHIKFRNRKIENNIKRNADGLASKVTFLLVQLTDDKMPPVNAILYLTAKMK